VEISKATDDQLQTFLKQNGHWAIDNEKLHREFKFENFIQAFGFMTQVAMHAQCMDHHPEWSNVYNKVVVDLTTHEAGGITDKDFELAKKIDCVAESLNS